MNYKQYDMRKEIRKGHNVVTISWIPETFAKKNKILRLKNEDGKWINGWIVEKVGGIIKNEEVKVIENVHRHQRDVNDV